MVVAQASDAEVDPSIHPSIHLRQRHTDAGWKVAWQIPCCENRGLSLPPWPISASIDPVSRAALADRRLGGGLALHDDVQLLPLPPRWPVGLLACWLALPVHLRPLLSLLRLSFLLRTICQLGLHLPLLLHLGRLLHDVPDALGVQHNHLRLQLVQQLVHLDLLSLLFGGVRVCHVRVVVRLAGARHKHARHPASMPDPQHVLVRPKRQVVQHSSLHLVVHIRTCRFHAECILPDLHAPCVPGRQHPRLADVHPGRRRGRVIPMKWPKHPQVPHFHRFICARRRHVPPRSVRCHRPHRPVVAQHLDHRTRQVWRPHRHLPVHMPQAHDGVVRILPHHAALALFGLMRRDNLPR
mmetsp:Transcript_1044/g.3170  ORF Transcript_1044/g.3170 Transcript_1044/m.3170 type:complete len:353 (+) Transcript_1044:634-1692(+)